MTVSRLGCVLAVAAIALPVGLHGQAMVGYGINVGRAGAAGTASGIGLGGILSKMKRSTDQSGDVSSGTYGRAQPQFEEEDLQSTTTVIKLKGKGESIATPDTSTRKMKSGVTISGIGSGPSSGSAAVQVREVSSPSSGRAFEPVAAGSAEQKTAATAEQGSGAEQAQQGGRASSQADGVAAVRVTAIDGGTPVADAPPAPTSVLRPPTEKASETTPPSPPSGNAAKSGTVEIAVGEEIERVIERLGKPLLVLKGIPGKDYTEKYTFRTTGGQRITVLALHGKVTAVSTGAESLPARAALP